ncbi:hypothetical protein EFL96_06250 [Lactococcus lactis]|uniref:Terminase small subunit n=1 Tax=Lactococcus lactis TaxID=1358 RepID=A0A6B3RXC9_9LACT|nr:hypothetical protein [Lactococcus lactis]MCT1174155.1 hypothetical protein [Lactococcus lactis]MCT1186500.1 hypothetical protein [Lactococcus lactis]MCT1189554.1 hypothetical protein [Lactococcus lactis]MCT1195270.1 hypothetical protein [Lactococcus lactis]NEX49358.1 hypothetical protein [Lactococcus lactis]
MAAKSELTAKQEAFAYAVGFESKNYSQAYREIYNVKSKTLDRTVWSKASRIANEGKVSARIDELKSKRREEISRTITWNLKEAENELLLLLKKNKNDIMRAEKNGQPAKHANNTALLGAIQQLTEIYKITIPEEVNEIEEYEDNGLIDALNSNQEGLWDDED